MHKEFAALIKHLNMLIKNSILTSKSPLYRGFMVLKMMKTGYRKSHTWAPFFNRLEFYDFNTIKSIWICDFGVKISITYFNFLGELSII